MSVPELGSLKTLCSYAVIDFAKSSPRDSLNTLAESPIAIVLILNITDIKGLGSKQIPILSLHPTVPLGRLDRILLAVLIGPGWLSDPQVTGMGSIIIEVVR